MIFLFCADDGVGKFKSWLSIHLFVHHTLSLDFGQTSMNYAVRSKHNKLVKRPVIIHNISDLMYLWKRHTKEPTRMMTCQVIPQPTVTRSRTIDGWPWCYWRQGTRAAPSLCHMWANEQQARAVDGAFWATRTMSAHHFLLRHTQTMGHVWSAWGPNPEERQMVPGIADRTSINMRKERDRGGGTGTLSPIFPFYRD